MQIRLTRAVKALIIACFATFLVQQTADRFFGTDLGGLFALIPAGVFLQHRFWQVFTYAFLHADVMHLFFNLLMLAFIGGELEAAWGMARFLRYYFFCSMSAGLLYLLMQVFVIGGLHTPMVGASGAIYGLLVAYGLIFGERVLLFMMLFPMKAKHFVWILAGIELMTTVFSGHSGLSGIAHLGGMAAGLAFLWGRATFAIVQRRRSQGGSKLMQRAKKRRTQPKHLKLIINNKNKIEFETTDDPDDDPPTFH